MTKHFLAVALMAFFASIIYRLYVQNFQVSAAKIGLRG